jgi:hypothetical protein
MADRSGPIRQTSQTPNPHLCGLGYTTGLLFPSLSTARTPKKKLSFDIDLAVHVVTFPTNCELVHSAAVVSRQTTS